MKMGVTPKLAGHTSFKHDIAYRRCNTEHWTSHTLPSDIRLCARAQHHLRGARTYEAREAESNQPERMKAIGHHGTPPQSQTDCKKLTRATCNYQAVLKKSKAERPGSSHQDNSAPQLTTTQAINDFTSPADPKQRFLSSLITFYFHNDAPPEPPDTHAKSIHTPQSATHPHATEMHHFYGLRRT